MLIQILSSVVHYTSLNRNLMRQPAVIVILRTLDPWLCVPVFQQVCLLFISYNKANCHFCQRNSLVKTYKNPSKKYENKKSVKISERIVTHDNHSWFHIRFQVCFQILHSRTGNPQQGYVSHLCNLTDPEIPQP